MVVPWLFPLLFPFVTDRSEMQGCRCESTGRGSSRTFAKKVYHFDSAIDVASSGTTGGTNFLDVTARSVMRRCSCCESRGGSSHTVVF